jgi:hypothetical protein
MPMICCARTGHHAIIDWLSHLVDNDVVIIDTHKAGPVDFPDNPHTIHFWNMEDVLPTIAEDQIARVHSPSTKKLLVMRSYRNWLASRYRSWVRYFSHVNQCTVTLLHTGATAAVEVSDGMIPYMENYFRNFIPMVNRVYRHHTEAWKSNKYYNISYDRWFASPAYRAEIAQRLSLPYKKGGIDAVRPFKGTDYSGCSAFDRDRYNGRAQEMRVLERWKRYRDDDLFHEILEQNHHLHEFSEEHLDAA